MNCKSLSSLLSASVFAIASLLLGASQAVAQTTPPMMVQVPWISMAAGGLSAGASVTTAVPAACTTGFVNTSATAYGDGCAYNNIWIDTSFGVVADKWGNLYFSDTGHKYVRVVYAGDTVKVNGVSVTNPAEAMILAANAGTTQAAAITANVSTTYPSGLVPNNVYAIAGGYTTAIAVSGTSYYCNKGTSGITGTNTDGSGCPATESYINSPYGLTVDSDGSLFIADHGNSVIYVVPANSTGLAAKLALDETTSLTSITPGYIYVIAGKGGGYLDGVLATAGEVHAPWNVAVDSSENLYIPDYTSNAVRMVNGPNNSTSGGVAAGWIHTIAGNCTSSSCTALATSPSSNVVALGAAFLAPTGIAVDSYGNIFIGDGGSGTASVPSTVRVIYAGGTYNPVANLIATETGLSASSLTSNYVYTIAGNGAPLANKSGSAALGNGSLATAATVAFYKIQGLTLDANGNIYIVDYSSRGLIAEVNANTGILTFVVGDDLSSAGGAVGNYCFSGTTAAVGGTGPTMTDVYGDGCPATNSNEYHSGGNPAFDTSGNLYMTNNIASGSTGGLIHKISFTGAFPATAVGSSATQTYAYELLTAAASTSATTGYVASSITVSPVTQGTKNSEFSVGADTCSPTTTTLTGFSNTSTGNSGSYVAATGTTTSVCTIPVTFTPAAAGARSGAVEVTATINGSSVVMTPTILSGVGNAAALVIDPTSSAAIGSGTSPQGVATDAAGNTYIAWKNGTVSSTPAGTLATAITGNTTNPHQVAIDGLGNVYVADTGLNRIAEFAVGASSATAVVSGLSSPQGVAVDAAGNLYIADTGNSRVLFQPHNMGNMTALGSGFTTPVAVAVDASGDVIVADSGLHEIVEIAAGTGTQTVLASGVHPQSLTVDAAGDIDYVDSALMEVVEIPVSGSASAIITGLTTPLGVALDQSGGLYVADSANTAIDYYARQTSSQSFASLSTTLGATLTNIGNLAYASTSVTQSDKTDIAVIDSSSNGCSSTTSLALAKGQNCALTANFTPSGSGTFTDTMTFTGNSATTPTLVLSGTNTVTVYSTTTTLGSLSPASPGFGQSVTLTATASCLSTSTVTCTGSSIPTGSVIFTVDQVTQTTSYPLNSSGQYTVTLAGLAVGTHAVSVTYTPSGNFTSSTSSQANFTVAALTITVTPPTGVVYGSSAAFSTTVAATSGVTPSGVLTYSINGGAAQTATLSSGAYTLSLSGLAAATDTVTASFTPTGYSNAQSTTAQSFTIAPYPITAMATSTSMVYGSTVPTLVGSLSGVFAADSANVTATFTTTATKTAAASSTSYPISVSLSGSAATNYSVTMTGNPGVTITQRPVTLAVGNASMVYGSAIPTSSFTGVFTNIVNSDSITATYSTTAVQFSPVNSNGYVITAGTTLSGTAAGNYSLAATAITNGTLTVTAKPITATVASTPISVVYGTAVPALNGTLTGVVNSDAVTAVFTTTATSTSPVATYPISVSLAGSAQGNYTVTMGTATNVTITKAPLSVYVNSATCEYGGLTVNSSSFANGCVSGGVTTAFGGSVTGIVGSDNVTVSYASTTATATSPVSASVYPITASTTLGGTAAGNYSLASSGITNGSLTITQAQSSFKSLTTSASNIGQSSPITFTATLVSDTSAIPTGTVVFTTGTTTLCSISGVTNGLYTCTYSNLPVGTATITASYASTTNFSAATATVAETVSAAVVTGTASSSSLTITGGSTGSVVLTTNALGGYTGTATYSCEVLPANMSCSFSPASSTFTTTTTTATTTLTISTKAGTTTTAQLQNRQSGNGTMLVYAALLIPGFFGLMGLGKGRKNWRMLTMMVLSVVGMAAMAGMSGCGGTSKSTTTPAGTYTIQVEITAGTVQVVPITVTVQ